MKRKATFIIAVATLAVALTSSCNGSDEAIGSPIDILQDYDLSQQTGASAVANQQIADLYQKYGSYFLYKFTDQDAFWTLNTGAGTNSQVYKTVQGDPANVEKMLQFLQDNWLKYFPQSFLQRGGLPYRVFLADSVYYEKDFGGGYMRKFPSNYYVVDKSIIIAGMNIIPSETEAQLKIRKIELINGLWDYYTGNGIIGIPDEFYDVTDYVTVPSVSKMLSAYSYTFTDEDLIAYRNRGFVPQYNANYGTYADWLMWRPTYTNWSQAKTLDLSSYMSLIFNAPDEKMEEYLQYPLIRQKWDILLNYYKDNYGIDLRKIALE